MLSDCVQGLISRFGEEAIYEKNGGNVSVSQALEEENLDYPKIRIPYQLD